jgi:glycosyltransferase involved in cell wall biosynthesis
VISVRGTDVNHYLFDLEKRATVIASFSIATKIIVLAPFTKKKIAEELPGVENNIVIIPHTVKLEKTDYDFISEINISETEFIYLVPAGIRPVKNVIFCLKPLMMLRKKYPFLRLIYVGPILDELYGNQFLKEIKNLDWVIYSGTVSHERMYSLYNRADVVINSSISEGMSNAILEAMSLGKAVLVSKIPGNEAIVSNEIDGLVFSSEPDFYSKAERFLQDEDLRKKLGEQAKKKVELNFSSHQEIEKHIQVYQDGIRAYSS